MQANELLNDLIPSLRTSDSAARALALMNDFKISHLPIVNETQFLGLISEDELIEFNNLEEPIGNHQLSIVNPFVYAWQHIYDVMELMAKQNLSIVPVIDNKNNYLGLITSNSMIHYFAEITSLSNPGAVIILEVGQRDYYLSEIARIVESNDAHILSTYISSKPDSTKVEITLKIDKTDLSGIIQSFERFNYSITHSFHHNKSEDDSMDRFDSFMNYLNI